MAENNDGPDLTGTKLVEASPLTYLLRLPAQDNGGKPVPTLVMMHGRGANQGDIYELVPYVDKRVMIVAPRAPVKFSDDPRGSFMWYENVQPGTPAPGTLETALEKLAALIDQLEQSTGVTIDRSQLYIGGFSQGAVMSYALVSAYPELVAGVLAHSGPFSEELATRLRQANLQGKPFFIAHGTRETMLPIDHAQRAVKTLKEAGADVTYREYPIAHETSDESRRDLADWLNSRLKF